MVLIFPAKPSASRNKRKKNSPTNTDLLPVLEEWNGIEFG
jgi:hypothetical protein